MIHTKQKEKLMQILNCSEAEAIEIMTADKRIDRGEKLFELDPELEAGAKKARQADRKPTERKPREKKVDVDKEILIEQMITALECDPTHVRDMCIINSEREFSFTYNGKKYKVVMSCPRNQRGQFLCILTKKFYLTNFQKCVIMEGCGRALTIVARGFSVNWHCSQIFQ